MDSFLLENSVALPEKFQNYQNYFRLGLDKCEIMEYYYAELNRTICTVCFEIVENA